MRKATSDCREPRKVRVLIVEDSRLIQERLSCLCSLMPRLEVVGRARDGVQALDAVRRLKPDVVTLDIGIPKIDGIEVLRRIKAEGLDCKGIVLTANIDEQCRRACLDLGATHVFDKVMEFDEVMQTLRAL